MRSRELLENQINDYKEQRVVAEGVQKKAFDASAVKKWMADRPTAKVMYGLGGASAANIVNYLIGNKSLMSYLLATSIGGAGGLAAEQILNSKPLPPVGPQNPKTPGAITERRAYDNMQEKVRKLEAAGVTVTDADKLTLLQAEQKGLPVWTALGATGTALWGGKMLYNHAGAERVLPTRAHAEAAGPEGLASKQQDIYDRMRTRNTAYATADANYERAVANRDATPVANRTAAQQLDIDHAKQVKERFERAAYNKYVKGYSEQAAVKSKNTLGERFMAKLRGPQSKVRAPRVRTALGTVATLAPLGAGLFVDQVMFPSYRRAAAEELYENLQKQADPEVWKKLNEPRTK